MLYPHRNALRAALIERGITQAEVARKCRVHRSTVAHVLRGDARSERIERFICKVIGGRREELFGSKQPSSRKPSHGTTLLQEV